MRLSTKEEVLREKIRFQIDFSREFFRKKTCRNGKCQARDRSRSFQRWNVSARGNSSDHQGATLVSLLLQRREEKQFNVRSTSQFR